MNQYLNAFSSVADPLDLTGTVQQVPVAGVLGGIFEIKKPPKRSFLRLQWQNPLAGVTGLYVGLRYNNRPDTASSKHMVIQTASAAGVFSYQQSLTTRYPFWFIDPVAYPTSEFYFPLSLGSEAGMLADRYVNLFLITTVGTIDAKATIILNND